MRRLSIWTLLLAVGAIATASEVNAQDPILAPGDSILAIDFDLEPDSFYPLGEEPFLATDSDAATKYLNFGKENSGMIITPVAGATTVQSLYFTSANDAQPRDPRSWELYGTNDVILSEDNSDGMGGENWTMIASGLTQIPQQRGMDSPVHTFANATSYESYRLVFPELRNVNNADSMQIADVYMFETNDGSGTTFLDFLDDVIAIDEDGLSSESDYPGNEEPFRILDGNPNTKYLNFGRTNSGFIVTPAAGASVADSFRFTTANDFPDRDPSGYEIYGTNDPITSTDNSAGDQENWTLLDSGNLMLPLDRFTEGDLISFTNTDEYSSYRVVITSLRDELMANSAQYADFQLFGTITESVDGDFNGDGSWDDLDIDALVAEIVAGSNNLDFDMNGDGVVDRSDITDPGFGWLAVGGANNAGATGGNPFLSGDANLDGSVDGQDFIEWNANKFQALAAWSSGDFTADGAVDGQDFIEWNNNKFMSSDSLASVPEPAACGLIWLAMLAIGARRRR